MTAPAPPAVVILAGGTGGAKLARGLDRVLPPGALTVVVNTADDTQRHGLVVMPDHDAVMYGLAGLADRERGWGIADETWSVIAMLDRYGEETWFRLGDRDVATHIARTRRLRDGQRLTDVCLALQRALGIETRVLPMTDEPVRTSVRTPDGWLEFQDYFVRRRQQPETTGVRYEGVEAASPTVEVAKALDGAGLIVIGPSNPIVSILPILELPGMRDLVRRARDRGSRLAAVSPIVAGRALKGPAARMLGSLGHEVSAVGVARLYAGLVDVFVIDREDAGLGDAVSSLGMRVEVVDTVMTDDAGEARLARAVLALG